jgi:hypothetical protein
MGNIVILPLPHDSRLACYDAWQKTSDQTAFGLRPRKVHFCLKISDKDAAEAQKCLPALSKT